MIAMDAVRPPLREAAQVAGRCEGMLPGRYFVHLRIDEQGRGHAAELRDAPSGVTPATTQCILAAFEARDYGAVAQGRPHGIRINFPFIVSPPTGPSTSE